MGEEYKQTYASKFVPMKNSRLCSKHFSADIFEKDYSQRPVLKPYAVPAIFNDWFGQVGYLVVIFTVYYECISAINGHTVHEG
jgi:hypothetical protein